MGTLSAVVAGFLIFYGLKSTSVYAVEQLDLTAMESAGLRLCLDLLAAGAAGALTAHLAKSREAPIRLASAVGFFTFCALFLVPDGPYVWFELARLPLFPACIILGAKLRQVARQSS